MLDRFYNLHQGETAWILGGGPGASRFDRAGVAGDVVVSMNERALNPEWACAYANAQDWAAVRAVALAMEADPKPSVEWWIPRTCENEAFWREIHPAVRRKFWWYEPRSIRQEEQERWTLKEAAERNSLLHYLTSPVTCLHLVAIMGCVRVRVVGVGDDPGAPEVYRATRSALRTLGEQWNVEVDFED